MLSRTTQDPLSLAEREGDKCRARHRNSPRCGSKERSDSMVPWQRVEGEKAVVEV